MAVPKGLFSSSSVLSSLEELIRSPTRGFLPSQAPHRKAGKKKSKGPLLPRVGKWQAAITPTLSSTPTWSKGASEVLAVGFFGRPRKLGGSREAGGGRIRSTPQHTHTGCVVKW